MNSSVSKIVVGEGITILPAYCFEYLTNATTIELPNTLIYMAANAFNDCAKLNDLLIPSSVRVIEDYFKRCNALADVYYMGTEEEWATVEAEGYLGTPTFSSTVTLHYLELVKRDATCTDPGQAAHYRFDNYEDDTCAYPYLYNLNKKQVSVIASLPALGHNYGDGEVTTAPTCTAEGIKTYTCQNDPSHTYTEKVSATGHDHKATVTTPTCEAAGYTTYTCACGDSYTADKVEARGHSYDNGEVTTAPTCTAEGIKTYTCQNDPSHTYTEKVSATGHDHKSVVTAPTCEAAGYTTYTCACGDSYVTDGGAALGHSYNDGEVTTTPTCTAEGVKTYTCQNDTSHTYTGKMDATGHNHKATVTSPTCEAAGYTTYTCACGDSYIADEVAALGHAYGKPFFGWAPDLSSVSAAMVCSKCSQGVRSGSCVLTWTSVPGKLTVIAAVSLADQPYMDTKVITSTVTAGKVVVSLPDAISGITIYAAGYSADHRMEVCVSKAVTDTLIELPVSGERIKLFFLNTRTLTPVMPCLIAR